MVLRVTSPLPTGMRTDDALDLFATALTLVLFALSMAEFAELPPVFFGNPVLPASHGPLFSLVDPIPASKEADVCKSGGHYAVQAALAEFMFAAPLLERAAPPILGAGGCCGQCDHCHRGGRHGNSALIDHGVVSSVGWEGLIADEGGF